MNKSDYITISDYNMIYGFKYTRNIIFNFVVLIIFIISLLLITLRCNYYTYYNGTFLLEKESLYSILVDYSDTCKIPKNGYLYVNNKEYEYKIKEVSDVIESGNIYFQKITIDIKKINNTKIFDGRIVISKKKLIKYIVDYLKGVKMWNN